MYLDEVMVRNVVTCVPTTPLSVVRNLLHKNRIHHVVVLEGQRVVGVVSMRDILYRDDRMLVMEVMTRDFATASPMTTIREAATRMIGRSSGCLPIIEHGILAGVITTGDLIRIVTRNGAKPVASAASA